MGVFRQFPYSNFHEMNMDEIIKIIKNMLEEWAQYHAEWDAWMTKINDDWSNYQEVMNEAWQNMQNFINNYFDNLDVQNEINTKITSMVNNGEFDSIVEPYIPPRVTAWLAEHITEPVGVVIDTSLTVSGACADAKATGDAINVVQCGIDDIEPIVIGETNYTNRKKIVASGADIGRIVNDINFATTVEIPVSILPDNAAITVDYGEISEASIFCLYNSDDTRKDSWALNTDATSRIFTFNNQDAEYVRFSFQKGYDAKIANQFGTVVYWQCEAINGIDDRFNNIEDTAMFQDDYLDYSMVNRLDPSSCIIGKTIDKNGNITDGSNYYITDYIKIYNDETLRFYRFDGNGTFNIRMFAAYDANKNVIRELGSNDEVGYIAQSANMAYIRCTFVYYSPDWIRTPNGLCCLAMVHPSFLPAYGNSPTIKSNYLRKKVLVSSTDTESQIISKLIDAYKTGNCDVYFERADYTFGTELPKVSTDYGMTHNEIPIGNNCNYYFNGSTLTATLDLSELTLEEGDDEFYCNFFGCQRIPSSYEMHDGVLIATDTRYIVHDESSALEGSYKHLYQNMEMHYHTNERQEAIRKCIGGGTGASGVVEIVGCKFTTDGTDACVSFHGNGENVVGAEFDLNIRDCWFSNGIRAGELSTDQTARLFYTGNSANNAPTTYARWTTTAFLNETRV